MRKLYTVPNCDPCNKIKEWIKQQSDPIELETIELIKIDEEWHEKNENGFVKFDKTITNFPALLIGQYGEGQNVYVMGYEGIQSVLTKGYIYESKLCPFLNSECIEKKCGKFVVMAKGPLLEGNCSDYWTPIILTEILTRGR